MIHHGQSIGKTDQQNKTKNRSPAPPQSVHTTVLPSTQNLDSSPFRNTIIVNINVDTTTPSYTITTIPVAAPSHLPSETATLGSRVGTRIHVLAAVGFRTTDTLIYLPYLIAEEPLHPGL